MKAKYKQANIFKKWFGLLDMMYICKHLKQLPSCCFSIQDADVCFDVLNFCCLTQVTPLFESQFTTFIINNLLMPLCVIDLL